MSVRACQVTMATGLPGRSQRVLMLQRMKGFTQQKRKWRTSVLTSKGAGTMAWSRLKRRVLLREDPESPWMSGGGHQNLAELVQADIKG